MTISRLKLSYPVAAREPIAVPVVIAAVTGRKGILMVRREFEPFCGLWGLPGGKVRYGESVAEAGERELFEETGLEAHFRRLCGVVAESVFDGERLVAHHLLLVCRLWTASGLLRRSREGDVRWFSRGRLAECPGDFVPSDRLILSRLVWTRRPGRCCRCVVRRRGEMYRVEVFH